MLIAADHQLSLEGHADFFLWSAHARYGGRCEISCLPSKVEGTGQISADSVPSNERIVPSDFRV